MGNRVVVTGMGAVTPIGNDAETFIDNLLASKVGIEKITSFDTSEIKAHVAAGVKDFDPGKRLAKRDYHRVDPFAQYALYSAVEAMNQAGLKRGEYDGKDLGVIYGSGIGGISTIETQVLKMYKKGPRRLSPLFIPETIINMAAGNISIYFGAKNTSKAVVTACATGTNAIGDAYEYIKAGKAKMMIAGGSEAAITPVGISAFAALTALSSSEDPERASMPFDQDRDGFVMGAGAGNLVLEDYDHAKARGAHILGEIVGYGQTSDAYNLTAPDPDGEGAIGAMQQALDEANIKTADLDYINAHGTATQSNDVAESKAISKLFKDNDHVLVSSTKGMTGHALGAAGAIEAVAILGAMKRSQMPVNVGVTHQDPESHIRLVDQTNAKRPVNTAISNSFGFGGHNAVLAIKKWNQ